MSGYLVITNKKKEIQLLRLTTKQQFLSAQFPMSKATVFVFVIDVMYTLHTCV